ncbi:hypothetical protein HMPREF1870_00067 [Bacteroidales bacterium KA00344]|nr:hypothetical protein HMPREF1870_00067 [Bacteroidales bacterium KA00344]
MVRSNSAYEALYDVVPVLITRQGDRIIFMNNNNSKSNEELARNEDNVYFLQKVKFLSANRTNMFSDKIELDYNNNSSLKFEIIATQLSSASQRVL